MTDYSSLTKAALLERIGGLTERLTAAEEIIAEVPKVAAPRAVPEAAAMAACIRALDDDLEASEKNSRTTSYNYGLQGVPSDGSIDRLLRSLAAKYGVPLIEVKTEPCQRPHVDSIGEISWGQ